MTLYGHALWTAVEWCRADGQDYRFCQVQCREPKTGQQKVQLYYEDDPLWPSRYMIYLCLGIQNDKAVSFKRYSDVAYQLATTAWITRRRKKNLHALFWKRRPDAKGMRTQKLQKWKLTHLKNIYWDSNKKSLLRWQWDQTFFSVSNIHVWTENMGSKDAECKRREQQILYNI